MRNSTYSTDDGFCAGEEVEVSERETHSRVLGPDGNPLAYRTMPFGFDTRHVSQNETLAKTNRRKRK